MRRLAHMADPPTATASSGPWREDRRPPLEGQRPLGRVRAGGEIQNKHIVHSVNAFEDCEVDFALDSAEEETEDLVPAAIVAMVATAPLPPVETAVHIRILAEAPLKDVKDRSGMSRTKCSTTCSVLPSASCSTSRPYKSEWLRQVRSAGSASSATAISPSAISGGGDGDRSRPQPRCRAAAASCRDGHEFGDECGGGGRVRGFPVGGEVDATPMAGDLAGVDAVGSEGA